MSTRDLEPVYARIVAEMLETRQRWRQGYQAAKDLVTQPRAGPTACELGTISNSATRQEVST